MMPGETAVAAGEIDEFHDLGDDVEEFRNDVLHGLSQPQKQLPCKYFYDERGSRLFDEICELEAYYPTRTEMRILEDCCGEIAALTDSGASLIEFGSGASRKVRLLLDRLDHPTAYIPIDISREHLLAAARTLAADYPALVVLPICADYTGPLRLPDWALSDARLGFFPGSTIGNFEPAAARAFLEGAAAILGSGASLVIGVDLKKDLRILHEAYNDPLGVTADFNMNLLQRINAELGGDIDMSSFEHDARYNDRLGRIEMHLVSRRPQTVDIAGQRFTFRTGETIHTENSYKYDLDQFRALAQDAGWSHARVWCDEDRLFSVHYLTTAT